MDKITDQNYLREQQYRTSTKLADRINIHLQFSTNPYSWQRWVFDQLILKTEIRVLEVGCGRGDLWQGNRDRFPVSGSITLGDLSWGMVKEASRTLKGVSKISYLSLDLQRIPYQDDSFDIVIANHMLYHVPDLTIGLEEISRVLKPEGRLYATTIGLNHMRELGELIRLFRPEHPHRRTQSMSFVLENATEVLKETFKSAEVRLFEGDLLVTEVKPLMDYILSSWHLFEDEKGKVSDLETYLKDLMKKDGHFFITKSQGIAIANN
jgi:ubiquinone/menaquinone biosynthesis C-methylase UbiE